MPRNPNLVRRTYWLDEEELDEIKTFYPHTPMSRILRQLINNHAALLAQEEGRSNGGDKCRRMISRSYVGSFPSSSTLCGEPTRY